MEWVFFSPPFLFCNWGIIWGSTCQCQICPFFEIFRFMAKTKKNVLTYTKPKLAHKFSQKIIVSTFYHGIKFKKIKKLVNNI